MPLSSSAAAAAAETGIEAAVMERNRACTPPVGPSSIIIAALRPASVDLAVATTAALAVPAATVVPA